MYAARSALALSTALVLLGSTGGAQVRVASVPASGMPPAGMCRVWIEGASARQQPAPTDCAAARARAALLPHARVIYGSSMNRGVNQSIDPRYDSHNRTGYDPRYDSHNRTGYDPRYDSHNRTGYDPRYDSRNRTGYDPRYDSRSAQQRNPRHDSRNVSRYDYIYDRERKRDGNHDERNGRGH